METSTLVFGVPARFLDAATLLHNGKAAQRLNAAYRTLKVTDACIDGTKACVSGGVAYCRNGVWVAGQGACSTSQVCFALPSNQKAGTIITCATESNALSAIEATGALGGIFGLTVTDDSTLSSANIMAATTARNSHPTNEPNKDTDTNYTDPFAPSSNHISSTKSPASTCTTARINGHSQKTIPPSTTFLGVVTQTITIGDEPTTLAPVIRTLSPEEAFSLLTNLLASGATIVDGPSASVTPSFPVSNITRQPSKLI